MATISKRKSKNGISYRAEVCVHNRRDSATFDTEAQAKAWAARVETEMRSGKYIDVREAKSVLLSDLLTRFAREITTQRKTERTQRTEAKKIAWLLRQKIAQMPVLTITSADVQSFISERKKSVAAATIVREIALLRRVINIAINRWSVALNRNVFASAELPRVSNARDRVLSDDERAALEIALAECENQLILPAFQLSVETGLRKSELFNLLWSDVDFTKRTIYVRDAKNGESAYVPLTRNAVAVLQALLKKSDFVFSGLTYNALTLAWKRARVRACVDIKWHDLRHTAITKVAEKVNGDIFKLKLFSRHKSTAMLARYVNLKAHDLIADLDRV